MSISESELEIMKVIWAKGCPVTAQELLHMMEEKKWKITTLLTFLSRLCEKGFLTCAKEGRANVYTACVSRDEYQSQETREFMEQVHSGSVKSLFAALYKSRELTKQDLEDLTHWLEEQ